jgi:ATP-dependent Clp protease protease subunit
MNNLTKDFRKFAMEKNVRISVFDDIVKKANNSLTPMVMEESTNHYGVFDIYSKMLCDRIIFFGNEFNTDTCNVVVAELLYLNSIGSNDINIYISSPGGSVVDGLSVIDTLNMITCDVQTTCTGMAASMGAVLLSSGTKGKRLVLPHSRVMIHSVSSHLSGTYPDMEIEFEQTKRCKEDIYKILAENMGKDYNEVEELCKRNSWYIGQEAVDIGLADSVINKKM